MFFVIIDAVAEPAWPKLDEYGSGSLSSVDQQFSACIIILLEIHGRQSGFA